MAQQTVVAPKTKTKTKPQVERPKLWKVILLNDDYTPREFVVMVLKAVFRMNEDQAYNVMMTAHQRGACVIAVFTTSTASVPLCRHVQVRRVAGVLAFRCHHAVFLVPWIEMTSGEVNGGSHLPTRERGRRGRRQEARSTRRRSRPASVGQCRPLCPECFSASLWRFAQPPGAPRKRGANPPVRLSWRGKDVHADKEKE